ncbi:MAG: TetR/AcrR family transcriptional regulator [Myxococcales bacterium]|nr:TetR/AcrR family transcriptional regulator [Myxococcales bacterium]
MPLARFEKLPEDRREAILAAALGEFAAHGFEGASYNRIIAAAGVSKGAMYYYFEDKADLYATVLGRALGRIARAIGDLGPVEDAGTFWREAGMLLARGFEVFAREPTLADLGRDLYRGGSAGGARALAALTAEANAWVARTLRAGQAVGAVRTDLPLDLLASAAAGLGLGIDRWFAEHWEGLDPTTYAPLGARVLALCRDLLEPRGESGESKGERTPS